MNDYERKQAEELAAQKYPADYVGYRLAYVEGYEAALETVAPEEEHRGATYRDGVQLDPDRPEPPFPGAVQAKPVGGDPSFGQKITVRRAEPQHGQTGYATGNGMGHG